MPPAILAMVAMLFLNAETTQPKDQPRVSKADYTAFAVAHLSYSGMPVASEWEGKI